jgi:hypothetical protein
MIRECGRQQDKITPPVTSAFIFMCAAIISALPDHKVTFFVVFYSQAFCEVIVIDPWEVNCVHCCYPASFCIFFSVRIGTLFI